VSAAGQYTFTQFAEIADGQEAALSAMLGAPFVLDSMQDHLVLQEDHTYDETGAIWGTGIAGGATQTITIQAHGTYTLQGSSITLSPDDGATFDASTGTLINGVLTLERVPGAWAFTKNP
jgi:hypothetical protein